MAKQQKPKTERIPTISSSQMDSWACRLRWHWAYRRGYQTVHVSEALELGRGVHDSLQAWYEYGIEPDSFMAAWAERRVKETPKSLIEDRDRISKVGHLGTAMLAEYRKHYAKEQKEDFEVLATEHTVRVPIPTPEGASEDVHGLVVGRLDGVVRSRVNGKLFALEHKTYTSFRPSDLEIGSQFTGEIWLGRHLTKSLGIDEPIEGVLYNGLRKQDPATARSDLFQRHIIYRNDAQIRIWLYRVYWEFRDMTNPEVPIYPRPSMECAWCDFKDVCMAYQAGEDYQHLLDTCFTSREQRMTKGKRAAMPEERKRFDSLVKRLAPKRKRSR